MARYIDAELLLTDNTYEWFDDWGNYTSAGQAIVDAPTADVVEVVRCKDCKYHCANYCTRDIKGRINMFYMEDEDFCSYGKKVE